jgi:predicted DNA-binding transcriptional regulator AlpA
MDTEIWNSEEIMKFFKISEPTLHLLIKKSDIPHFYLGKKSLRFRKESVMQWLAKLEGGVA